MRVFGRIVLTIVAGLATVSTGAYPDLAMDVSSVRVRFRTASAANDLLDLRTEFAWVDAPAFDATRDDVRLDVGSTDSFRVGPDVAAVARTRGKVVTYRRARRGAVGTPSPFRSLSIDFGRGLVRAVVDHAGAFALRQDGPWNAPIALHVGAATFTSAVDFGVSRRGTAWNAPRRPDRTVRIVPGQWFEFQSSIWDPRTVVVRDDDAWTALWAEHVQNSDPKPAKPTVDFSRDEVVAVFRRGTGIDLTIDGLETKSDRIVAHFTVRVLGYGCLVLQYIDAQSAFALLPRSDLPVEFDERFVVDQCLR
jgi:hypothetical protein